MVPGIFSASSSRSRSRGSSSSGDFRGGGAGGGQWKYFGNIMHPLQHRISREDARKINYSTVLGPPITYPH